MLSSRARFSLYQYLALQDSDFLYTLFRKHGILADQVSVSTTRGLDSVLSKARREHIQTLLTEIVKTRGDLRCRVSPRQRYDERWDDLVQCLQLDGYRVDGRTLVTVDPTIEGAASVEDDLSVELRRSRLSEADNVLRMMETSAEAFREIPPNCNACLTNARIALETLARAIAKARSSQRADEWAAALIHLRESNLISKQDEKGLAGVYTFVSQGAHRPLGLTEVEMTRLGRSLVAGMCYFLVKLHNNQH
jgi:vacuolar-type H+-ATPase subunit E/Vma4